MAVVWVDVMPADDAETARRAQALLTDGRVRHLHDPGQHAARAWAPTLSLGGIAWDVYLLFAPGLPWRDPSPTPTEWFHQLGDERADPDRRRTAQDLARALHEAGTGLGWPTAPEPPDVGAWHHARASAMARLVAADAVQDGRCPTCRAQERFSSCSLGGWRRLVMEHDGQGMITASGTAPALPWTPAPGMRLSVTGMLCPECMLRAASGAIVVDGVARLEVLLDEGEMSLWFDPGAEVGADALVLAVRSQGFGAAVASERP